MVARVQITANKNRQTGRKCIDFVKKSHELLRAVLHPGIAFQMRGCDANWAGLTRQDGGHRHAPADTRLIWIRGHRATRREPAPVDIQAEQGKGFEWNRRQDRIAVPTFEIHIMRAVFPFRFPAQIKLEKLDSKHVMHPQRLRHDCRRVALCSARHTVIHLAQKDDVW